MQAALVQSWPGSESAIPNRWYVRLLPCLTDFAFILPLFLLFKMRGGTHQLFSDADTGWHIRTGDWILQHGRVPLTDMFSFTMPGQPWFAWEWGWDVVFSSVHKWTGLAGVAFLNIALLSAVSALLFRLIRRYSDNDILAFAFTMLAVCGSIIHWLARPHLISWVFALVFAHLILSFEQGDRKALRYTPVLMVLWTNLHGGFFIGIILLLTSAVAEAAQVTFGEQTFSLAAYRNALTYLTWGASCALATLLNPYTWHLHEHVFHYLRDSSLLDSISEFQSISFHNSGTIFFESMLLLGAAAAFWCFAHKRVALGLTVLLWAHAALFSGRNIPLFMLLAAAPAALMVEDLLPRLARSPWSAKFAETVKDVASEFRPLERVGRSYLLSGAALLFVGCNLATGTPGFRPEFNPDNFPVAAISAVHTANFSRLFTVDQWADYMIYRYYPSQRVFIDGRTDFYGSGLVKKYQRIISAQYDCEALLKNFAIDGVFLKIDAPLTTLLKRSPHWQVLYDDGSSILFKLRDRVD